MLYDKKCHCLGLMMGQINCSSIEDVGPLLQKLVQGLRNHSALLRKLDKFMGGDCQEGQSQLNIFKIFFAKH